MSWWRRLLGRRGLERSLEREIQFHLENDAERLRDEGMEADEARRVAHLNLGSAEAAKEACREARGTQWLEDMARDVRQALRGWGRHPGMAAAVIATLALGIGTVTLMATLVEGVLLRPLPFARPGQLVRVQEETTAAASAVAVAEGWGQKWAVAYPNYRDLARETRTMELGAYSYDGDLLSAPGPAAFENADAVSANLFSLLGVRPIAGRGFSGAEAGAGGSRVAMLGAVLANERFGSAAAAVGGRIQFGDELYRVIGVLPEGFDPGGYQTPDTPQVFTPLEQEPAALLDNRGRHFLTVVGRLQGNASLAMAEREQAVIARRLQAAYPKTNAGRDFVMEPLRADVGAAADELWLLAGAAGLVLLLALANIACLLLTRALAEEGDAALRAALGAGRGRLVRQCLTGSLLYGLAGGGLGVALAQAGLRPLVALWPGGLPRGGSVSLDGRVLAFAFVISVAASMVFGLAPALRVRNRYLDLVLRRRGRGSGRGGAQRLLVAAQVGLALVLLAGAGALGGALVRLSTLNLGVDTQNVLTGRVALPAADLSAAPAARAAWEAMLRRLRAIPGVVAATTVDTVPLREGNDVLNYWTGTAPPPEAQQPAALATTVGTDYFRVMGIRLRRGRVIDARDQKQAPPVVVIDEHLARKAFGGRDPIGQQLHLELWSEPLTVVGVVAHVRYWGPAGDAAGEEQDEVYYALAQLPDRYVKRWSQLTSIAVRTGVAPAEAEARIKAAVQQSGAALYEVRTLQQLAQGKLGEQRFLLVLFGLFAALALLVAMLGVYGVGGWLGAQRTPELAVRLALGASRSEVFWMMLRQGLPVIAAGAAGGVAAAWAAGRLLQHAVPGVSGVAPVTMLAAAAALVAAALVASVPPARRACRTDPVEILRQI